MFRRFRVIAVACLCAALVLQAQGPEFGLHMDLTNMVPASARGAALERAYILHATVCRNNLFWQNIEPNPGEGRWDDVDAAINEQIRAGVEPLLVVVGSPAWASKANQSDPEFDFQVPTDPSVFQDWVALYADFVTRSARRYKGKVTKWELWNEPNEHFTWRPVPSSDRYAQWFTALNTAIKAVDPSAVVSVGGLTGLSATGPSDIQGTKFLADLYRRGLKPDVVSIHPYSGSHSPSQTVPFKNNFTDIAEVRKVMEQFGQQDKKIWLTEWGWSSHEVTEAKQADFVAEAMRMTIEQYPYVSLSIYFLDQDRPPRYFFGLFDIANREKPAGNQFRLTLEKLHPKPSRAP